VAVFLREVRIRVFKNGGKPFGSAKLNVVGGPKIGTQVAGESLLSTSSCGRVIVGWSWHIVEYRQLIADLLPRNGVESQWAIVS
jgi:hypothetical protein